MEGGALEHRACCYRAQSASGGQWRGGAESREAHRSLVGATLHKSAVSAEMQNEAAFQAESQAEFNLYRGTRVCNLPLKADGSLQLRGLGVAFACLSLDSEASARRRYQIFREHYDTLLRLKSFFPFHLIDSMGTLSECREQVCCQIVACRVNQVKEDAWVSSRLPW